jgi:WD40 repeat protein
VVTAVAVGGLGGRPIAVSASYDRTLRVWDLATWKQRRAIAVGASIHALAIDGTGGVIVGATPGVLRLTLQDL